MDSWLTFIAAAALLLTVPGPTTLAVVGFSSSHGRVMALVLALTVAMAHATTLLLSIVGLRLLIESYPAILTTIQLGGAAYFVFLMINVGSRLWKSMRQPVSQSVQRTGRTSTVRAVTHTFLVTLLNPNTLLFFVALLPQFVNPSRPATQQVVVMAMTFVALSMINSAVYGLGAAEAAGRVASRRMGRQGGSVGSANRSAPILVSGHSS